MGKQASLLNSRWGAVQWERQTRESKSHGENDMLDDFSPHQQRIIKRYYSNEGSIQHQRLAELVTELYLAEGKKRERVWKSAVTAMQKLGLPQARIDHIVSKDDATLLAQVVKELEGKK